ncbi:hypothetical protein [Spirosoma arcticum]
MHDDALPAHRCNFRLDLSSPATVRYTEFDNTTFTGTWSVPSDNRLVLSDAPTQRNRWYN